MNLYTRGDGYEETDLSLAGPGLMLLCRWLLAEGFGASGAWAIGVSLWMIFWWITRPVGLTVTALLPVVANAFLSLAPMDRVLAQYASSSIVLLLPPPC